MATKLGAVLREAHGLIIRLAPEGIYLREKGRRLEVGPRPYRALYQDLVQQTAGLSPLRPRQPRGRSSRVSRGLLATARGQ